jgi:hypothetical protein
MTILIKIMVNIGSLNISYLQLELRVNMQFF